MPNYHVEVPFVVEASSPAMAIRKLMNALMLTIGNDSTRAMHAMLGIDPDDNRREIPPDTNIACDDPRLIAGAFLDATDVYESENGVRKDDESEGTGFLDTNPALRDEIIRLMEKEGS